MQITRKLTSGPVGQTVLDTVAGELVCVGSGENKVTLELGVDNLGDDVLVGDADDQAVFGGVVLVLGLGHKALTGVVVGLTLYTREKTPIVSGLF